MAKKLKFEINSPMSADYYHSGRRIPGWIATNLESVNPALAGRNLRVHLTQWNVVDNKDVGTNYDTEKRRWVAVIRDNNNVQVSPRVVCRRKGDAVKEITRLAKKFDALTPRTFEEREERDGRLQRNTIREYVQELKAINEKGTRFYRSSYLYNNSVREHAEHTRYCTYGNATELKGILSAYITIGQELYDSRKSS